MHIPGFKDRTVAVFGLGQSGLAVARALSESGAVVLAWDDSGARRTQAVEAGIVLGNLYARDWRDISTLVLSPGVPLTHPEPHGIVKLARAAGAEIIGDVEIFQRALAEDDSDAALVGITGTNGKSTTTALIGHMVSACGGEGIVGGNIGRPILSLPEPHSGAVYVIEVSSYQIDLAPGFAPKIGILLNITPDHIDRHGSFSHYASVKARLFDHMGRGETAIINVDDEASAEICTEVIARRGPCVVPISTRRALGRGVYVIDGVLYENLGAHAVRVGDLKPLRNLAGAHNWQNAAAAYAAGRTLGFERDDILEAFSSFPGLAHRMELICDRDDVSFVNDSKATNAEAAAKALSTYENIFWIVGGQAKDGGIDSLASYFPRVQRAYLIGEAAETFARTLDGDVAYRQCGTLEQAVAEARKDAAAETGLGKRVVLLSPACASFDQFPNFEARGDAFRRAILGDVARDQGGAAA